MSQSVSSGNTKTRDTKVTRNRCRRWCFTLNNYTKEEYVSMSQDVWDNMKIKKYVFQEEIGENLTAHLQGVVEFASQIDFSRLKKYNERVHWSKCRDIKASIKYCSKEKTRKPETEVQYYGEVEKWLWKEKPKGIEGFDAEFINKHILKQIRDEREKELREASRVATNEAYQYNRWCEWCDRKGIMR